MWTTNIQTSENLFLYVHEHARIQIATFTQRIIIARRAAKSKLSENVGAVHIRNENEQTVNKKENWKEIYDRSVKCKVDTRNEMKKKRSRWCRASMYFIFPACWFFSIFRRSKFNRWEIVHHHKPHQGQIYYNLIAWWKQFPNNDNNE